MYNRKILCFLGFFFLSFVSFSSEDTVPLDAFKPSLNPISLQRGARTFINYCMNCHSASGFRYAGLQKIGLKKEEILKYLAPGKKLGDFLVSSMLQEDAKKWFGVIPPDLSWVARSRGSDWIYTYLRSFYRDNDRPNGWNNTVFPGVNMPNVFYDLEGVRSVVFEVVIPVHGASGNLSGYKRVIKKYPGDGSHKEVVEDLPEPGHFGHKIIWGEPKDAVVGAVAYDQIVFDLVNFMSYMADPSIKERESIGFFFLTWLLFFSAILYALKANFWKDFD